MADLTTMQPPKGIPSSLALRRPATQPLFLESALAAGSILIAVAGVAVASIGGNPARLAGVVAVFLGVGLLAARLVALFRQHERVTARLLALSRGPILGVAIWREDGSLVEANDAFLSMIGETPERAHLITTSSIALHPPEGAEADLADASQGFVEREIVAPDGTTRFLAWGTRQSAPDEVLTFAVDITDRVTSEMGLRKAREVLERRVQELEQGGAAASAANGASAERSVVHLAERLAAANAELEAFSYSVAHDLRAPLRTIDGFSRELLATFDAQLGEQGQHYLNRIRAGTQRMGSLIEALLELSRVSRVEVRRQTVDVSAAARVIVQERQSRLAPHAVVRIADGLTASADSRLLQVILDNLLGNALKFSAKREAPLIELFSIGDGPVPAFCVRDNGAGFEMRYAEKLFTPFHRMHSPAQFEGTGIGLALVHRAITRHGGTIRAESEPGSGTSILFTLEPAGTSRLAENQP